MCVIHSVVLHVCRHAEYFQCLVSNSLALHGIKLQSLDVIHMPLAVVLSAKRSCILPDLCC